MAKDKTENRPSNRDYYKQKNIEKIENDPSNVRVIQASSAEVKTLSNHINNFDYVAKNIRMNMGFNGLSFDEGIEIIDSLKFAADLLVDSIEYPIYKKYINSSTKTRYNRINSEKEKLRQQFPSSVLKSAEGKKIFNEIFETKMKHMEEDYKNLLELTKFKKTQEVARKKETEDAIAKLNELVKANKEAETAVKSSEEPKK